MAGLLMIVLAALSAEAGPPAEIRLPPGTEKVTIRGAGKPFNISKRIGSDVVERGSLLKAVSIHDLDQRQTQALADWLDDRQLGYGLQHERRIDWNAEVRRRADEGDPVPAGEIIDTDAVLRADFELHRIGTRAVFRDDILRPEQRARFDKLVTDGFDPLTGDIDPDLQKMYSPAGPHRAVDEGGEARRLALQAARIRVTGVMETEWAGWLSDVRTVAGLSAGQERAARELFAVAVCRLIMHRARHAGELDRFTMRWPPEAVPRIVDSAEGRALLSTAHRFCDPAAEIGAGFRRAVTGLLTPEQHRVLLRRSPSYRLPC